MKQLIVTSFFLFAINTFGTGQTHLHQLNTPEDFKNLSGMPLSDKYGQVKALKIVYDRKADKLYFINSKYFKYHHEFCTEKLNYKIDLAAFNELNYSDSRKRKYLLANLNYFKALDRYILEISPVDMMAADDIYLLHAAVSKKVFCSESLGFLLNSSRLNKMEEQLTTNLALVKPADIYYNLNYQSIGKYTQTGVLRFIDNLEESKDNINPKDIVVINATPNKLPSVSGVLVTEFQTPLSHLSILGQNRKIPICTYKQAFEDEGMRKFEGLKVELSVKADTFLIREVDELVDETGKRKVLQLKKDLSIDSLVPIEFIGKKSSDFAGNKAANFGVLHQISSSFVFKTPESAFVIPFYFYEEHINESKAKKLIAEIIALDTYSTPKDTIKYKLKKIRKAIEKTPVDSMLLTKVENMAGKLGNYERLRFRSSTNAEDARGFSGAGLYKSKTGILNHPKKTIEEAIREVWSSLWSYEAFSERDYFNLDQSSVSMAILVHRSFPNEEVNGVAITKNLYREDAFGFVVNAQLGNEKVVQPRQGVVSDQFICYPNLSDNVYADKQVIDVITYSSLSGEQLVMSDDEIQHLANQLEQIKRFYSGRIYRTKPYLELGLDVEFKLDGNDRSLYIKQIRIYND